jgi:hypothetical protein
MYSPGEVVASCSIFNVAPSKVSGAAFHAYVPSSILTKISKVSSMIHKYCGLVAVSSTIVHPVKQDVEHKSVTEQTNRD